MRWLAWLLLACAAWSGCAGTETGNPSFEGKLGYDAYTAGLRSSAVPRVEAAWLVLGDVGFATPEECEGDADIEAHAKGLGAGDHVATQAPVTRFTLAAGRYCEVRLPFEPAAATPQGAPAELAGHSIVLAGTLSDGRSFQLASAYRGAVSLRASGGFTLDEREPAVVIGFDLGAWLDEIAWPSGSAAIRIDASNHVELLQAFEARLARGVVLFRDQDADGELDPDREELARGRE